jgi:hypothetical protein
MARKGIDSLPVLRPRVKGVTHDTRPLVSKPTKLQVEAGHKQWRLIEAVRAVHPGAWSRYRNGMAVILYPDREQAPIGTLSFLVNGVQHEEPEYPMTVLCENEPNWKLAAAWDIKAWQQAYKLTKKSNLEVMQS